MRVDLERLPSEEQILTRAHWIVTLAIILGGGAVGGLLVGRIAGGSSEITLAALLSTSLLSAAVVFLATRADASTTSAVRWGIAGGILNVPAWLLACELLSAPGTFVDPSFVLLATVPGAIVGGPLGLVFGALYTPLLIALRHERARPSLQTLDELAVASGAFLVLAGLLSMLLAETETMRRWMAGGCALAFAITLVAAFRRSRRARWLERVLRGHVEALRAIPVNEADVPPGTLAFGPEPRGLAIVERGATYRSRPRALLVT